MADLRQILTEAMSLAAAGAHDQAIRRIEAAGGAALAHPVVRNLLGDIYLKQGRKREALKSFDAAAKIAPTFPEAH